jgi:hypothetical protein
MSAPSEAAFAEESKVWRVIRKAPKDGKPYPEDKKINQIIAMVRDRVAHPLRILKRQFGYVKTRGATGAWPRTARSSSRCSRSAICSGPKDDDDVRTNPSAIYQQPIQRPHTVK